MTKSYRQGQILKLIRGKRISTQEELAQELEESGHRRHAGDALARHPRTAPGQDRAKATAKWPTEEPGPQFSLLAGEFLQDVLPRPESGRAQNQPRPRQFRRRRAR